MRIAVYKHGVDPSDHKQYDELHAWLLAKMDRFRKVFAARIKSLQLGATGASEEVAEPTRGATVAGRRVDIDAAGARMERALRCDGWL